MSDFKQHQQNYQRIAKAIEYLIENQSAQPKLPELAAAVGVSEFHLQRMFTDWAGVSPKQFLQYLTKENAKQLLRDHSVLDTALSLGLSGAGRLHDLLITTESVTPGEYRKHGAGLDIAYGVHPCPFGFCFIAATHRGVCKIAFMDNESEQSYMADELNDDWGNANIEENQKKTAPIANKVFGKRSKPNEKLTVLLKGSPFQLQVWEALLSIPQGEIASYQDIARAIGSESSVRAVASAVARNNIAYLIPCHRVIRSTGVLNNYRWGDSRKAAIIGWEGRTKMQVEPATST